MTGGMWLSYLGKPSAAGAAYSDLSLGLALSSKFSMLVLLPLLLLVHGILMRIPSASMERRILVLVAA